MNKLLKQPQQMENKRRSLWRKVAGHAVGTLIVPEHSMEETVLIGLLFLESFDLLGKVKAEVWEAGGAPRWD